METCLATPMVVSFRDARPAVRAPEPMFALAATPSTGFEKAYAVLLLALCAGPLTMLAWMLAG